MTRNVWIVAALAVTAVACAQSTWKGAGTGRGTGTHGGVVASSLENAYCGPGDVANFGGTDGPATLPTDCVYTAMSGSPSSGATVTASDSADLAAKLAAAGCGDTIVLTAGAKYTGPFTLPAKACDRNHWITLRTSAIADANFPKEGVRATPCEIGMTAVAGYPAYACAAPGQRMATIEAPADSSASVVIAAAGAKFYRLIGVNVQKAAGSPKLYKRMIDLSNGADHIIFDRILCHGETFSASASNELLGCVFANNSTYIAVVNSWMYDTYCMGTCTDSQVYVAGTGTAQDGPHKLYNNLLATGGESWIFGGGGNYPAATPVSRDIEIRSNHSFKPLTWMLPVGGDDGSSNGVHPINKNHGEFKNGERILLEGNVMENNWHGWQTDQTGNSILISPKNQNNKASVTATISGNTLTATSGTFSADMVDTAGCPVDLSDGVRRCYFEITGQPGRSDNGDGYRIASVIDATHATLTNVTTGGDGTGVTAYACHPGDCPGCYVRNVTARYNEIRNTTNGFQIATALSSHCNDEAAGMDRVSIHDVLLHGLDDRMSNGNGPNIQSRAFDVGNGARASTFSNFTMAHNTAIVVHGGASSVSGLVKEGDATNVAYLKNMTYRDNIASGGIVPVSGQGAVIAGGPLAGLNAHDCKTHANTYTGSPAGSVPAGSLPDPTIVGTPPETNCTWLVTKNVFGMNQWPNQTNQSAGNYPYSNQACGAGGESCFLDGAAFASAFRNFAGGYLGDFRLANGSPFRGQGSDGRDIGADVDAVSAKTAGVAVTPAYVPVVVTSSILPNGTVGVAYPQTTLAANGNSPFKEWTVVSGNLPTGLILSRGGRLGWLGCTQVARNGGVSTLTCPEDINAGGFVVGQVIGVSGLVAPYDTFNGTFVLKSFTAGGAISFDQAGPDVAVHAADGMLRLGPMAGGTFTFGVQARDGAKRVGSAGLSIVID